MSNQRKKATEGTIAEALCCVRLARALDEARKAQGVNDGPCYLCGELTESLSGDPSRWPVMLCHPDDPGKPKHHHAGCVSARLRPVPEGHGETARAAGASMITTTQVNSEGPYILKEPNEFRSVHPRIGIYGPDGQLIVHYSAVYEMGEAKGECARLNAAYAAGRASVLSNAEEQA